MANTSFLGILYPDEYEDPFWNSISAAFEGMAAWIYSNAEDKYAKVDGEFLWNVENNTLTWNSPLTIFSSRQSGPITVSPGSVTIAEGNAAYVEVSRPYSAQTVTVSVTGDPITDRDLVVIAMRYNDKIFVTGRGEITQGFATRLPVDGVAAVDFASAPIVAVDLNNVEIVTLQLNSGGIPGRFDLLLRQGDTTPTNALQWEGLGGGAIYFDSDLSGIPESADVQIWLQILFDGTVWYVAQKQVQQGFVGISSIFPADNATNVAVDTSLSITFSAPVTAQAGNINLYDSNGLVEAFDVTTDISGSGTDTISFTPTSDLDNDETYYVLIDATAFDDASGNSFQGITNPATWNFVTAVSDVLLSVSPADDATDVAVDASFSMTFSAPVTAQAGNINLYDSNGLVEAFDVTTDIAGSGTDTISFTPTADFDNSTNYYVLVDSGAFQFASGNPFGGISDPATWNISTIAAAGAPIISNVNVSTVADVATVTWDTNIPSDSLVEYGTTAAYGNSESSPTLETSHSIQITGISRNVPYHFRITSDNGEGDSTSTNDNTFESEAIIFQSEGATFEPLLTVTGTPTIEWIFEDDDTSSSATPSKDYGTVATRNNYLRVTPWSALTGINLGYDASDNGSPAITLHDPQDVSDVSGLSHVAASLTLWASSYNPFTSLDFSGFSVLDTIECYLCQNITSVDLTGAVSLTRICFENNDLSALDISDCVILEDLRAALNDFTSINFGTIGDEIWHICIRDNPQMNTNIPPISQFPRLRELWCWNAGQTGVLDTLGTTEHTSLRAYGNAYTSADLAGAFPVGTRSANVDGNLLTSLDVTGNPGLLDLSAANNSLSESAVDTVLSVMEAYSSSNGDLDLSGNSSPSNAGILDAQHLIDRGWTVVVEGGMRPVIESLSPADNSEDIQVNTSLSITFSTPVTAQAGNINLYDSNGLVEAFDVTTDIAGSGTDTISFTPTADLDNDEAYYVLIDATAFDDASGNSFQGITNPATWNFVTAVSEVLLSVSPADDATDVAVDASFSMTFSTPVTAQTGNINLYDSNGLVEAFDVTTDIAGSGTDTISFTPTADMDNSTNYYVLVDSGALQFTGGNPFGGISDTSAWNFSTEAVPTYLWRDLFDRANGPVGNSWVLESAGIVITDGDIVMTEGAWNLYGVNYNMCGGVLPANYRTTVTIPHATVFTDYYGLVVRRNATTGIRVMFASDPAVITIGQSIGWNNGNVAVTVTGGIPASWATNQDHTFAVEVNGATVTVLLDGQEYGYATLDINNETGTGVGFTGEDQGRHWRDITVEAL